MGLVKSSKTDSQSPANLAEMNTPTRDEKQAKNGPLSLLRSTNGGLLQQSSAPHPVCPMVQCLMQHMG
jgi:hypothetical protein